MIELILALLLIANPLAACDVPETQYFFNNESGAGPQKIENNNLGVKLTASKFFVKDIESNKVLYGKDYEQPASIASITKLMTALVFLDTDPSWQSEVKMLQADETYGAYPHIYRGESATVKDLFNTMLVSSDNNSAMALVRVSGLSEKEFVEKMNIYAKDIGLMKTNFVDVTGLSEENVSSAEGIANLLSFALKKKEIAEVLIEPSYSFKIINNEKTRKVFTTNRTLEGFLNSEKYGYQIIGGKTGYLPEAGGCLAVMVEKDGHRIVSVILGSDNMETRFQDMKALVDWIYLNYTW